MPPSRIRPMATTVVTLLHLAQSLASHSMLLFECPLWCSHCPAILFLAFLTFSSPRASHHSPFRVPLSPHVRRISKLDVSPAILLSILVLSFQVFLSIHDTLNTCLKHHISNASLIFFSAFLIAWVSYPYNTIWNINAFTSLTVVTRLIPLSSM